MGRSVGWSGPSPLPLRDARRGLACCLGHMHGATQPDTCRRTCGRANFRTPMERRTKIVATIGPASRDPEVLARMVEAGMDVARLNFSHGSADEHAETARRVRDAAGRAGRQVAILQDLPGPEAADRQAARRRRRVQARRRRRRSCAGPTAARATPRGCSSPTPGSPRPSSATRSCTSPTAPSGCGSTAVRPEDGRDRRGGRDRRRGRLAPGPEHPGRDRGAARRCPRRTSSTCAPASGSASTSSRCRSCAAPRTSSSCASTRGCRWWPRSRSRRPSRAPRRSCAPPTA